MGNKGYTTLPGILSESITFLAGVLPVRSVPTFIELLIGGMLTQTGFVTNAWPAAVIVQCLDTVENTSNGGCLSSEECLLSVLQSSKHPLSP